MLIKHQKRIQRKSLRNLSDLGIMILKFCQSSQKRASESRTVIFWAFNHKYASSKGGKPHNMDTGILHGKPSQLNLN